MPADDDELDDAVFARVRAARPRPPAKLAHEVLQRTEARTRGRRAAAFAGAALACAVIVYVVVRVRPAPELQTVALATDDALAEGAHGTPADAGVVGSFADAGVVAFADAASVVASGDAWPGLPPPRWDDISSVWVDVVYHHATPITDCGGTGAFAIAVTRASDGTAKATYPLPQLGGRGPTPVESCRAKLIEAIRLPAMPPRLESITFVVSMSALTAKDPGSNWSNPLAAIDDLVAQQALRTCMAATRSLLFVVDRGSRVRVPRYQFGRGTGEPVASCVERVLASGVPKLPAFIGELQVSATIVKD